MAKVTDVKHIYDNVFKLSIEYKGSCKMGQFFMLRAWDIEPLLSRPLSIYDYNGNEVSFVYQVVGKGTEILSRLNKGDEITLQGPYGNGFPYVKKENITLVGGGMGAVPLYYAAKELMRINPQRKISIYLGSRFDNQILEDFKYTFSDVTTDIGGMITDRVELNEDTVIFTCGPRVMMEKLYYMTEDRNIYVYASIEERMACGVGACLACTCKTAHGNKRVCKDGPVFLGEEIFYE